MGKINWPPTLQPWRVPNSIEDPLPMVIEVSAWKSLMCSFVHMFPSPTRNFLGEVHLAKVTDSEGPEQTPPG
jgi:hypothetical protein